MENLKLFNVAGKKGKSGGHGINAGRNLKNEQHGVRIKYSITLPKYLGDLAKKGGLSNVVENALNYYFNYPTLTRRFKCQKEIEDNGICQEQCPHCKDYYNDFPDM